MMECPYCGKTCEKYHPDVCDYNPSVQKKMYDLIGLSFKVDNLFIKITEVMPGVDKPINATILEYEKKNDVLTASVHTAMLHYASVIDRYYEEPELYNGIANRLIEDIKRSMI